LKEFPMRTLVAMTGILSLAAATPALAQKLIAPMALATPAGPGDSVGEIDITEGVDGAMFHLNLHGLQPGKHGFHVHAMPSCAATEKDGKPVPAGGAGGHLDPDKTGMHMGPMAAGHLGDLPYITVAADGTAKATLTAPRIKSLDDLKGHSLMIHDGGDNYADQPLPLGGGGARFACGVIGG
jgi:Cu-Zn family superoxide dismutase